MKIFSKMKAMKLEKAIERYPQIAENYVQLAKLHQEDDEFNRAEELLRQALALNQTAEEKAGRQLLLVEILLATDKKAGAEEVLNQADPEQFPAPARGRLHLLQGQLLSDKALEASTPESERAALMTRAVGTLEQAVSELRVEAGLWTAHERLIELYEESNQFAKIADHLLALEKLAGSYKAAPQSADAIRLKLAELHEQRLNDQATALRYYEKIADSDAFDDDRMGRIYSRMGGIKQNQDDPVGAIERYEMALRFYGSKPRPETARIRYELAMLYQASGRTTQAFKEMERAAEVSEIEADFRHEIRSWLANYLEEQGDLKRAFKEAELALAVASREAYRLDSLERRGRLLEKLDRAQDAVADYEQFLLKASPIRAANVHTSLARIYASNSQAEKALEHANAAIEIKPSAELLLILGKTKWEQKDALAALRYLLRLCDEFRTAGERTETMRILRAIRQELNDPEKRTEYQISESDLGELDELLAAAGEETDIIRRLRKGLAKTQMGLVGSIERLLTGRGTIDDDLLEELSDVLLLADLGVDTTAMVISAIREKVQNRELRDPQMIKKLIRDKIEMILMEHSGGIDISVHKPFVIMMVGVNGVGKTTTIAKLTKHFKDAGASVLLAAADTFRAGAIEQLDEWGKRVGSEVIKQAAGSDPSAVAFDAVAAAQARNSDCLIVDTAGRLHTKINLMEELKKVRRVIDKKLPGAPHEILLVVDATTGQNAITQAEIFHQAVGVSGVILTKMDGTAKGGIIVRIVHELKIPVKFIGIGEGMDDLRPFSPKDFVTALFG